MRPLYSISQSQMLERFVAKVVFGAGLEFSEPQPRRSPPSEHQPSGIPALRMPSQHRSRPAR
jgi:hypothetical protein